MAKKTTKITPAEHAAGVYVYLGPTIQGVISNGAIFNGTFESVLQKNAIAIKKAPSIKKLIVKDTEVIKTKALLKAGGNALSHAYKTILSQM